MQTRILTVTTGARILFECKLLQVSSHICVWSAGAVEMICKGDRLQKCKS